MDGEITSMKLPQPLQDRLPDRLSDVHWTHGVAAGSLLAGAFLLITGRRRTGLAVAAAGAAVTLLENPEALREFWKSMPRYIRNGQDFLVRVEDFVEELNRQGIRLRKVLSVD